MGLGADENGRQNAEKPASDAQPGSDAKPASDAHAEAAAVPVRGLAAVRYAINRRFAALLARVITWLDRNAARQGGEWGARMEYKRRYTNPDAAVRAREPLPDRRKRERRS